MRPRRDDYRTELRLDLNFAGGRFVGRELGKGHREYSFLERGIYPVRVNMPRQRDSPSEGAVSALHTVIALILVLNFALLLAHYDQGVFVQEKIYVFLVHAR